MTDYKNKRYICEYNLSNKNQKRENETAINNYYFDINKKNLIQHFSYYINYKILICINVFLNINNYKHNLGFIFCSIISFLIIILFIIVFFHGLPKIKIMINREIPTKEKLKKIIKENYTNRVSLNNKKINKTSINNPNKRKKDKRKIIFENINQKDSSLSQNSKNTSKTKINDLSMIKPKACFNDTKKVFIHRKDKKSNSLVERNKKRKRKRKVYFTKEINSTLNNEDEEQIYKKIDNYNELTYKKAINFDKRNIFQIFGNKIIDKLELFNILSTKKIIELHFSKYIIFLLIDVTTNALLLSDYVISYKFHHNGNISFIIILVITISSNLFSLFIEHYLSFLIKCEEIIERIKEIKEE